MADEVTFKAWAEGDGEVKPEDPRGLYTTVVSPLQEMTVEKDASGREVKRQKWKISPGPFEAGLPLYVEPDPTTVGFRVLVRYSDGASLPENGLEVWEDKARFSALICTNLTKPAELIVETAPAS
ncbi:hypothetical protein [Streptomyces sp. NPDC012756]|uniref:hypothetical protein n=1 Tax=Streptomyces sp. NPDC012756 TaxID=3364847 RepID=UPI003685E338